jgi:phosphosulfolactate phosphohydrolase-like enzyme
MAKRTVRIDALPESAWRCSGHDAIVVVDVLLSSTTIVTGLSQGRRVFAAPSAGQVDWVYTRVSDPQVITDAPDGAGSPLPFGGPAWLAAAAAKGPLVHVSPLAEMLSVAVRRARVYVACLRNLEATANEIGLHHRKAIVLGVGERGEVCAEDQMVAAWLAMRLQIRGFELEGRNTAEDVERWRAFDPALVGLSRSAERLRARGWESEVDFVLRHLDDLNVVCGYADGEFRDPATARQRVEDDTPTPAWGIPVSVPGQ